MTYDPESESSQRMSSIDEYTEALEPMAQYLHAADPQLVVRNGLIERVAEILDTPADDRMGLHKEIGDVVFYLNAAVHLNGGRLSQAAQAATFGEIQQRAMVSNPILPLRLPTGEGELTGDPQSDLTLRMLRVVDIMNPKTSGLWIGCDILPNIDVVVHDALLSLSRFATSHNVFIEEAVSRAVNDVRRRDRQPHVIDKSHELASSGRERLTQRDVAIRRLLAHVLRNNY